MKPKATVHVLKNTRSISEWAERIRGVWQDSVSSIFELGNLLETARQELGAAQFQKMIRDELKYSQPTVSRLMIVADDQRLRDYAHGHKLPNCWRTLYELTKLTDEQFQIGIDTGVIHAGMERKDIKVLKGEKLNKKQELSAAAKVIGPVDRCTMAVRATVLEIMREMKPTEWDELLAALRDELNDLEQVAHRRREDGHNTTRQSA